MLFVDAAHECGSRRQYLINEDEYGLLWRELDALADNINELANGKVGWDQIFLFVDRRNIRLFDLFANDLHAEATSAYCTYVEMTRHLIWGTTYRNAVCILLSDSLSFSLALLERVLVLELGTHIDDVF